MNPIDTSTEELKLSKQTYNGQQLNWILIEVQPVPTIIHLNTSTISAIKQEDNNE